MIVAITGNIGAGKTTLGRTLAMHINGVHLDSDLLRRELVGDVFANVHGAEFELMATRTQLACERGVPAILTTTGMSPRFRTLIGTYPHYVHVILRCSKDTWREREIHRTDRPSLGEEVYHLSRRVTFAKPANIIVHTDSAPLTDVTAYVLGAVTRISAQSQSGCLH